jgi:pyridoxal phosphate enzyme (YggS family)
MTLAEPAPIPEPDNAPGHCVAEALGLIRARIVQAARQAGRAPDGIRLVAVSKTHPAASVEAALAAGQTIFGENRVQEAQNKFPRLRPDWPDLRLHLIGPLQTNKADDAVRLADVIETLDRTRLADALEQAAQKAGRLPTVLVQVNIGAEPQKAGVLPTEADRFIDDCRKRFGDALVGLMAIPPAQADPVPFFRRLAEMASAHGLFQLSMGMSGDFEQAIACGATSVRVGTAIFGGRPVALPLAPARN